MRFFETSISPEPNNPIRSKYVKLNAYTYLIFRILKTSTYESSLLGSSKTLTIYEPNKLKTQEFSQPNVEYFKKLFLDHSDRISKILSAKTLLSEHQNE